MTMRAEDGSRVVNGVVNTGSNPGVVRASDSPSATPQKTAAFRSPQPFTPSPLP